MKILLIEDSKFQRIANERALVKAGYGVIHAGDREEDLRVARENIPDLFPTRHDVAQATTFTFCLDPCPTAVPFTATLDGFNGRDSWNDIRNSRRGYLAYRLTPRGQSRLEYLRRSGKR